MKIALVQYTIRWEDVEGNLQHLDQLLKNLGSCDVVVLPEMFTSGFTMEGRMKIAPFYDRTHNWLLTKARELDAMLVGSVICCDQDKYYNRLIAVQPDGHSEYYDKRHGFTYGGESRYFEAGTNQVSFMFRGVRFAPFICYDLRFPVWSRNTQEYDVAIYIANWPVARIEVWKILLAARAIENQCFTVGVNCVGDDGNGMKFSGESCVINSRGKRLGGCEAYEEEVKIIDIKLTELRNFRRKFPVLNDMDHFIIEK